MTSVAEAPQQVLTGEGLLKDFGEAVEIATAIGGMESWLLRGKIGQNLVRLAQNYPVETNDKTAVNGLPSLLSSEEEKMKIADLVKRSRALDLGRYVGHTATFKAHSPDDWKKFEFTANGPSPKDPTLFVARTKEINLFKPADGTIRIGTRTGLKRVFSMASFWEIKAIDTETGLAQVDVKFANEL